jgi:HEAT repeat protein
VPGTRPSGAAPAPSGGSRARTAEQTRQAIEEIGWFWNAERNAALLQAARGNAAPPAGKERERLMEILRTGLEDEHGFARACAIAALARAGGTPEDLKTLLAEGDPEIREASAAAMGYSGDAAWTRPLAETLLDAGKPAALRAAAAVGLGLTGSDSSYLANGLDLGGDAGVRGACLAGLSLRGNAPSKMILGKVIANRSERDEIRALALGFLGKGGSAGGVDPSKFMISILADRRAPAALRRAAAIGLRRYANRWRELLDAAEADPAPEVRGYAWVSLARMDAASGARKKDLRKRMRMTFSENAPPEEKALLALALGWTRDEASADSLLEVFSDRNRDAGLRAWCARGLGLAGFKAALPALIRGTEERGAVASASVGALALIGGPGAFDALRVSLFDGAEDPRRTAAAGLARTRAGRSLLNRALGHEEDGVRIAALLALGAARDLGAVKAPLEPDRPLVRSRAYRAIGDALDARAVPLRAALARDLEPGARREALILFPD